ncbi:MAG: UDP-2,4-diacetamido-2,4,6-trideoxy-beta-L-altropyranose hydrolase, partial [Desulfobacterales bacterium]|nr:UDP-2,4-diacetamido-2,4,6-trideoxy-beta-L-altropyranose hydrolase [Desulfobacterales bacterium]
MRPPLAVIRADGGSRMGAGHLMRCLALAQAWQRRRGQVVMVSHCDIPELKQRFIHLGCDWLDVPEREIKNPAWAWESLQGRMDIRPETDWWILDGYGFDTAYQRALGRTGLPLLVLDDHQHLPSYHAHILLNQNSRQLDSTYVLEGDTRLLSGPGFALLREEFQAPTAPEIPARAQNILATLGGADPDRVTEKVMAILDKIPRGDFQIHILAGPANPALEALLAKGRTAKHATTILAPVEEMRPLIQWADLVITAGGSTCWELAALGAPMAVIATADNQRALVQELRT